MNSSAFRLPPCDLLIAFRIYRFLWSSAFRLETLMSPSQFVMQPVLWLGSNLKAFVRHSLLKCILVTNAFLFYVTVARDAFFCVFILFLSMHHASCNILNCVSKDVCVLSFLWSSLEDIFCLSPWDLNVLSLFHHVSQQLSRPCIMYTLV